MLEYLSDGEEDQPGRSTGGGQRVRHQHSLVPRYAPSLGECVTATCLRRGVHRRGLLKVGQGEGHLPADSGILREAWRESHGRGVGL